MVYRQKIPSPKKLAVASGERYYFTGKPCKHGHISKRWTYNGCCVECGNENTKRWARENNQHVAEKSRQWRIAHPEKAKIVQKKSNSKWFSKPENKEKARQLSEIRYALNGDEIRRKQRERGRKDKVKRSIYNKEWRAINRDYARAQARKWAAANPEKVREGKRNAKAKRKNVPGKHSAADIAAIKKMQKNKCAYCRTKLGKKYHIDHILPVSKGGTNDRYNLQITCVSCNLTKGARDPIFHAQTLGMLL